MSAKNFSLFIGNLGKDAELKYTQKGKPMLQFSVAVNTGWGDNKKTMWVPVTFFGTVAEKLAPSLTKGTTVAVSGELGPYNRSDGSEAWSLTADSVEFVGKKRSEDGGPRQPAQVEEEDLPF